MWRWIGSRSSRSAGSSGRKCSARPVSTRNQSPADGTIEHDQLVELVADALGRHDLQARTAFPHGGDELGHRGEAVAGDEPGCAQHAQRVVVEADLRRQRRPQRRRGEIGRAAERVDQLRAGRRPALAGAELEGHRVHREVASAEVGLDVVGERHVRLPGVVGVRLGPERRDLHRLQRPVAALVAHADGAELLALGPDGIGPSVDQPLDLGRTGVGGEVEIEPRPIRPDEQVADGAAHQVEAATGGPEAGGERGELVQHRREAVGDHVRGHVNPNDRSHSSRAAVTASDPGPPELGSSRSVATPARAPRVAVAHAASASRS